MGIEMKGAKLVASQGASGEIWADDKGRFAFLPHNPSLANELVSRQSDLAVLLFDMLMANFRSVSEPEKS